jgi:4-amino-4-deoxy-L-arabinose transferase-like glycosyltransferase
VLVSGSARVRVALCAALFAGLALVCSRGIVVPGLVWSDELVYAAAGRHVADGHGPVSSFYHPDAIAERGLPQPDVHMPGQALLLGAAFRLLGPREDVAVATSALAFVLSAALVAWTCTRRGTAAALAAAALFVLFPPQAPFAHTAMAESALCLTTVVFATLWLGSLEDARPARAIALALVLAVGATQRETFLVYAAPAAWAIARWPTRQRWRGGLLGGGVLLAYLVLVFLPFYRARAAHPHVLTDALQTDGSRFASVIAGNLRDNLASLPLVPREAWQWVYLLQLFSFAAALAIARWARDERRPLAWLAVWGVATTWIGVALFYPLADWRAVRVLMPVVVPAIAVVGSSLVGPWARRPGRDLWRPLVAAGVLAVSIGAMLALGRDRRFHLDFGRDYAAFLAATLPQRPAVVVATKAYRYGWEAYPVAVVVWEATDLKRIRTVEQSVPVDAIVIREEERRRFLRGMEDGAYGRGYARASAAPFHGRYHAYVTCSARPGPPAARSRTRRPSCAEPGERLR